MSEYLKLSGINKKFLAGTPDERLIFEDYSFSVKCGEFVSVIGSNGSGKTTLLNLICGTYMPDSGDIVFDGRNITRLPEHRRASFIGRVLQDPRAGTCPSLTILENLALADNKNHMFSLAPAINKRKIAQYREQLSVCNMGLEDRLSAKVGTLSGGQRQALAMVISVMSDVSLLILDEHTAALDPKAADNIMELTDYFVRSRNITTVMVTHNLRYAVKYGNRLVMMHEGHHVLDITGEEKSQKKVSDLLDVFNEISIEAGN